MWRDALSAGALVGERYRIVRPLARGGFGAVYEAEQITTERRVAVKILVRRGEGISAERMLGEARIASRLTSEHIVQVIDAGIDLDSSAVFVAMELLSGATLAELVEREGSLGFAESAEFLRQIAAGLDKAHGYVDREGHRAPIVHRDLKPANVFVTRRDDGTALLKILDFGTAKVSSSAATSSHVVRGTPQFMAPEQISGETVTPATDVWALGLLGFFLLTGRSYWRSVAKESPTEALFAEILTLPLAPASERARSLGASAELACLDAWFARAVARAPAERFESAGQAAREFARALGVAVSPVAAPRSERFARPAPAISTTAEAPQPQVGSSATQTEETQTLETMAHAALAGSFRPERSWRSRAFVVAAFLAAGAAIAAWAGTRRAATGASEQPSAAATTWNPRPTSEPPFAEPSPSAVEALPAASVGAPSVKNAEPPRAAPPAPVRLRGEKPQPALAEEQAEAAPRPSKSKPSVYEIR